MAMHAIVLYWYGFSETAAIADSVISNSLLCLACLLVCNTLRYYLPRQDRYAFLMALVIAITVIWFFISRALLMMIKGLGMTYEQFFSLSVPVRLAIGFLILGSITLLSVLWYTLQQQKEEEQRKADADKLVREAELYKLREQLQPHFLFNSLNSINALIGLRPQEARRMIEQLSDFLRGTLKREEQQWVSLSDELHYLQLYLEIEKVRFGHRLNTDLHCDEVAAQMKIPAMLLQPVVENAIKFGLYDTTEVITISIDAVADGNKLVIRVCNPFDSSTRASQKGTGFGLHSVQRRLYLLFAMQHLLHTEAKENIFITTITIPQSI